MSLSFWNKTQGEILVPKATKHQQRKTVTFLQNSQKLVLCSGDEKPLAQNDSELSNLDPNLNFSNENG
jgi:hypothetical protein